MLRSADIHPSGDEGEILKLHPDILRSKWRNVQILNQLYMSAAIDSTWRQKQFSAIPGSSVQSAFSELGLGLSESSSTGDDDFGTFEFGLSENSPPKCVDGGWACTDVDTIGCVQSELWSNCVQSVLASTPCLSGWLSKKKASGLAFMTPFSRWRKSWFVVMMEPAALILNRYDGDTFSAPTKATILDFGRKVSREPALDGRFRFCFSVLTVDSKTRIVLAGDSKAQAENWVATLNSVMAEMRAGDAQTERLHTKSHL
jgi:hypothetical protein